MDEATAAFNSALHDPVRVGLEETDAEAEGRWRAALRDAAEEYLAGAEPLDALRARNDEALAAYQADPGDERKRAAMQEAADVVSAASSADRVLRAEPVPDESGPETAHTVVYSPPALPPLVREVG